MALGRLRHFLRPVRSVALAPRLRAGAQRRYLNLHEYQSMEIMKQYGVPVPRSAVASTADEAEAAYHEISGGGNSADVVIKAYVLAGGRGLGTFTNGFYGGVHICTRPAQAKDLAGKMLQQQLVTKQTGAEGRPVDRVFLMERLYMRRELYLSLLMDRGTGGPVIVASYKGGTSIEDVAEQTPEAIMKVPVANMEAGPTDAQIDELAHFLGFDSEEGKGKIESTTKSLYKMFLSTDATLVEVNPLAETPEGGVFVCDAKINFDDNAEFRQSDIFAQRDEAQEDAREVEAAKWDLNYIGLDGDIGCMVNGAGLAMATLDIIKLHGGNPANFLDVGGGATEKQVQAAFKILNSDEKVRAILVNIFGGIVDTSMIAKGIVAAAKSIGLRKPLIVRLQGTNVDNAKKVMEAASDEVRVIMVDDLDEAAEKAVKVANIVSQAEEINVDVNFELPL